MKASASCRMESKLSPAICPSLSPEQASLFGLAAHAAAPGSARTWKTYALQGAEGSNQQASCNERQGAVNKHPVTSSKEQPANVLQQVAGIISKHLVAGDRKNQQTFCNKQGRETNLLFMTKKAAKIECNGSADIALPMNAV